MGLQIVDKNHRKVIVFLTIFVLILTALTLKLKGDLKNYISKKTELQGRVYELRDEVENLTEGYKNASTSLHNLSKKYDRLRDNFTSISSFLQSSIKPPYVIAQNRSLFVSFKDSKGSIRWKVPTNMLERQVITGTLIRELEINEFKQINSKYNIGTQKILDDFEGDSKYKDFGNIGRYYQIKPFIDERGLRTLSKFIDKNYASDEMKVRAVWRFINQTTIRSKDLEEDPRLPLETLLFGGGDCEDIAFLTASIIKGISDDWEINIVLMDKYNPQNPEKLNHAVVHVGTGEYSTFIETLRSREMNPYEEINGFYIEV